MSSLIYTFSDFQTKISEFLGVGSSPEGDNLTKVKDIVCRGYTRFLFPTKVGANTRTSHIWSFLEKYYVLSTESGKWKYALPEDFGKIITNPEYSGQQSYNALEKRNPDFILHNRNVIDSSSFPTYFAIVNSDYDLEIGTSWEMWLYETPNQSYDLQFFYKVNTPKPESDGDYLVGSLEAQEALVESCLAVAEQQEEDGTSTIHTNLANILIQDLIASDTITKGDSIGRMTDPRHPSNSYSTWRSSHTNLNDANIYP